MSHPLLGPRPGTLKICSHFQPPRPALGGKAEDEHFGIDRRAQAGIAVERVLDEGGDPVIPAGIAQWAVIAEGKVHRGIILNHADRGPVRVDEWRGGVIINPIEWLEHNHD